jgi:hypothetical protein
VPCSKLRREPPKDEKRTNCDGFHGVAIMHFKSVAYTPAFLHICGLFSAFGYFRLWEGIGFALGMWKNQTEPIQKETPSR